MIEKQPISEPILRHYRQLQYQMERKFFLGLDPYGGHKFLDFLGIPLSSELGTRIVTLAKVEPISSEKPFYGINYAEYAIKPAEVSNMFEESILNRGPFIYRGLYRGPFRIEYPISVDIWGKQTYLAKDPFDNPKVSTDYYMPVVSSFLFEGDMLDIRVIDNPRGGIKFPDWMIEN